MRRTTRIVIADDHAMFRAGLRLLIEREASLEIVGEATDTREASWMALDLVPDVLVLDLSMPGGNVVQAIKQILSSKPTIRIVILTMYDDPAFLRATLAAGAVGYVLKRSAHGTLIKALEAVRAGRMYVDPAFPLDQSIEAPPTWRSATLSAREHEVLVLLARGLTYREAGEQLHISERTIETHRRNIADKLGLRTRADLLRYALETGLLAAGAR